MMPLASAAETGGTTFATFMDHVAQAFEALGASLLAAEAYTAAAKAYRSEGLARLASSAARLADGTEIRWRGGAWSVSDPSRRVDFRVIDA